MYVYIYIYIYISGEASESQQEHVLPLVCTSRAGDAQSASRISSALRSVSVCSRVSCQQATGALRIAASSKLAGTANLGWENASSCDA